MWRDNVVHSPLNSDRELNQCCWIQFWLIAVMVFPNHSTFLTPTFTSSFGKIEQYSHSHERPLLHLSVHSSLFSQERHSTSPRKHYREEQCWRGNQLVYCVIKYHIIQSAPLNAKNSVICGTYHHHEWRKPGGSPRVIFFSHLIWNTHSWHIEHSAPLWVLDHKAP